MLSAGFLRQRISVIKKASPVTYDSLGQPIESWVPHVSLWANVRFESGVESIRANRVVSEVKASIRIRPRNDITEDMRIMYKDYTFNILSKPLRDMHGEYMDLPVSTRES